jgi:hypothetical protein
MPFDFLKTKMLRESENIFCRKNYGIFINIFANISPKKKLIAGKIFSKSQMMAEMVIKITPATANFKEFNKRKSPAFKY